jgi:hypothetical protein
MLGLPLWLRIISNISKLDGKNSVIKAICQWLCSTIVVMTFILDTVSKLAVRRRAAPLLDVNADFTGRRTTGDPRLDLAIAEQR